MARRLVFFTLLCGEKMTNFPFPRPTLQEFPIPSVEELRIFRARGWHPCDILVLKVGYHDALRAEQSVPLVAVSFIARRESLKSVRFFVSTVEEAVLVKKRKQCNFTAT